ncbi:hypothetical protein DM860_001293 [Cuscuta australis]|uniref:Uncharacterized protein n=1 Tax=Cuscuta australis TaxID=267555 RepID=A0A328DXX8_9ASTE|nr:hypothetical protein DM860_001293 [Cuscuta australis]
MPQAEGTAAAAVKPQQISEMFQKFAHAFKAKTFELFADEETSAGDGDGDGYALLNSAEEFIPDQKVVVIKPDSPDPTAKAQFTNALVSSLFANVSSFEASYLQLQMAHAPFSKEAIESADKALVSTLQKLTEIRNLYWSFRKHPSCNLEYFPVGSVFEFQVQENQSKLRSLETMVNRLQSDIESKDDEVLILRKKLNKIQDINSSLSKKLGLRRTENSCSAMDVVLTIHVFESMLRDSIKSVHCFSKILLELMRKAGWDLKQAANSVYSDVNYAGEGHEKYAFLSYVFLQIFRGFDKPDFGTHDDDDDNNNGCIDNGYMRQLVEHLSCNPMDVLQKNPNSGFSRFCERKYEQLIHPTMESSIFSNMDRKEVILDSWKSLGVFCELFVRMASSIWLLHKLAFSFNPIVEIFQVQGGADFSMVHMEDVTKKNSFFLGKTRPKVGFTVVPGFKIGKVIIQSQVYLTGFMHQDLQSKNSVQNC